MILKMKSIKDTDFDLCSKLKKFCYDINGCCQVVHKEMGPYLNEYMYQDALEIMLKERNIPYDREYYFSVVFRGERIRHKHYVDFRIKEKVYLECKAVEKLGNEQRQQLWNYMRLTKTRIGILYNFAPLRDQCEHYYLDTESDTMYYF